MSITADAIRPGLAALAAPIACGCCLLAGAVYVAVDDPSGGGTFLPCPFRALTGAWCVGCGMTRATHHLLRGDVAAALRFNLLVIPVLLFVGVIWATWLAAAAGRSTEWTRRIPGWGFAAAVVAALGFAVVRNLPGVDGLRG